MSFKRVKEKAPFAVAAVLFLIYPFVSFVVSMYQREFYSDFNKTLTMLSGYSEYHSELIDKNALIVGVIWLIPALLLGIVLFFRKNNALVTILLVLTAVHSLMTTTPFMFDTFSSLCTLVSYAAQVGAFAVLIIDSCVLIKNKSSEYIIIKKWYISSVLVAVSLLFSLLQYIHFGFFSMFSFIEPDVVILYCALAFLGYWFKAYAEHNKLFRERPLLL